MADERLDPQAALIHVMVVVSASDRQMPDRELRGIGDVVKTLPAFRHFDPDQLTSIAADCARRVNESDGLDRLLGIIADSLPAPLHETAYALACEIAAVDERVGQEEMRVLELLRHKLGMERLVAAAIERCVRARHVRL